MKDFGTHGEEEAKDICEFTERHTFSAVTQVPVRLCYHFLASYLVLVVWDLD
jgi:hypothetical protein